MQALRTLVPEPPGGLPLTPGLLELYGGDLTLGADALYSNFVSSLDGVVALGQTGVSSGPAISGRSQADRFVMGLLRACADCVLVGAGTVRDDPGVLWTADFIFPDQSREFGALRAALGLSPQPALAVVTRSGRLDRSQRVFKEQEVIVCGPGSQDVRQLVDDLRERGYRRILCEGGPHLLGELAVQRLLDEIFLTLSPVLAGQGGEHRRLGMVEGVELLPGGDGRYRLLGLKQHGDHLFLHYGRPAGG